MISRLFQRLTHGKCPHRGIQAVSLLLAMVSMWSMGMLFAPVSIVWPPVEGFLQGLEYPIYILCGFLFPLLLLRDWLRPVSYALPPFWAVRSL